jgi:hypothetical protein
MTINTTNITSGPYTGNNALAAYSYTFRVTTKDQLSVYETTDLGVQTLLTVDTDYTVANLGEDAGGTITRVAGNLPTGYQWYIKSNYAENQLTSFSSQGGFFPDVHEAQMDHITFLIQQLRDSVNRNLSYSQSTDITGLNFTIPLAVASRVIAVWNDDANGLVIGPTVEEISNAETNAIATAADLVQTGLDRIAAASSAASAATVFDNFDDKYLGAKASEPSTDNDGNALVAGALYFLIGTGMQTWDGASWIASSSVALASLYAYEYIATGGQTTFSGTDTNGQTLAYTSDNIHVTAAGLDIPTSDYVATDGTSLVLDSGATVGTIVRIVAFQSFVVANTYTKAQADALFITDSEIRAAVEAATDSNVFTDDDHDKLDAMLVSNVVYASDNSQTNVTSTSWVDIGLSLSITPSTTTSRIQLHLAIQNTTTNTAGHGMSFRFVRNSTALTTPTAGTQIYNQDGNTHQYGFSDIEVDSPATTSAITYKVQVRGNSSSGTRVVNIGGVYNNRLIATEIGA